MNHIKKFNETISSTNSKFSDLVDCFQNVSDVKGVDVKITPEYGSDNVSVFIVYYPQVSYNQAAEESLPQIKQLCYVMSEIDESLDRSVEIGYTLILFQISGEDNDTTGGEWIELTLVPKYYCDPPKVMRKPA